MKKPCTRELTFLTKVVEDNMTYGDTLSMPPRGYGAAAQRLKKRGLLGSAPGVPKHYYPTNKGWQAVYQALNLLEVG
jgi:hypothetical protein